ncbi:MAG: hypothetical protein V8R10_00260 [Christensenellales bacterium]
MRTNVQVVAADGTGIGYALVSDGLDNGMENILLPRERLSDAQPFHTGSKAAKR